MYSDSIEVEWQGPFSWPSYEDRNGLKPIPRLPGVYLQTFEYEAGYIIYAAGITRRPIPERFNEHTRNYLSGDYTILDVEAAQQGIRKEIWHGWGYAREHRSEFEKRKDEIVEAARRQLVDFRIFIANLGIEPRIHERLEASVMNNLYSQPSPFCDIPDRGMQLAPRRDSEEPIVIENICADVLHWLPIRLKI